MKRWVAVGAAAIGVFAVGVVAGVILSSKANAHLRAECLALFNDQSVVALTMMNLMASGRVDAVYDLLEGQATACLVVKGAELRDCTTRLKLFYEHHPERQASLELRHPDAARALGYAKTS